VFSYDRKLVETAIKTDRLLWLKSVDDSLKTKPKDFWKHVSKLKKIDHVVTQVKIGKHYITQAQRIVEAFANHFSLIFSSPSSDVIPNNALFTFSDFLNFPSISTLTLSRQFDAEARRGVSVQMISPVLLIKVPQKLLSLFWVTFLILVCYKGSFPLCGSTRPRRACFHEK
jgi:hypothetical protein